MVSLTKHSPNKYLDKKLRRFVRQVRFCSIFHCNIDRSLRHFQTCKQVLVQLKYCLLYWHKSPNAATMSLTESYENLQLEQQLFKESGYFSGFHPRPFTSTLYPGCMEMALSVNILFAYHRAVFIIFPFFLAFCIFCCYCCCWWWFLMVYKPRQDLIETEYGAENHPFHEKCHIVMAI